MSRYFTLPQNESATGSYVENTSAASFDTLPCTAYASSEICVTCKSPNVVVTRRNSTAQEMTPLDPVQVGELEPSEAIELFQRTARMAAFDIETTEETGRIVKELGYLALAIILAGSYVSMTPRLKSDVKRYLPEYKRRRKELLQRRPKRHVHQYEESVLSTWETSLEAITNQDPTAARLLSLLVFVNFEDINLLLISLVRTFLVMISRTKLHVSTNHGHDRQCCKVSVFSDLILLVLYQILFLLHEITLLISAETLSPISTTSRRVIEIVLFLCIIRIQPGCVSK